MNVFRNLQTVDINWTFRFLGNKNILCFNEYHCQVILLNSKVQFDCKEKEKSNWLFFNWSLWAGLNRRPVDYESTALPTEPHKQIGAIAPSLYLLYKIACKMLHSRPTTKSKIIILLVRISQKKIWICTNTSNTSILFCFFLFGYNIKFLAVKVFIRYIAINGSAKFV